MLTNKKMENTNGFLNNLGSFFGSMGGAVTDPYVAATIPLGGTMKMVGTGAKAVATTALRAGAQEAMIATVAEIPIQAQVFDWKNERGIDYSLLDAVQNGGLGVLAGATFRATGSAIVDTAGIAKLRLQATKDGKIDAVDVIDEYDAMTKSTLTDKVDEHVEILSDAKQAIEEGRTVKVTAALDETAELSSAGRAANNIDAEVRLFRETSVREIEDRFYIQRPLSDVNQKPMLKTGTDDIVQKLSTEFKGLSKKVVDDTITMQEKMRYARMKDDFGLSVDNLDEFNRLEAKYGETKQDYTKLKDAGIETEGDSDFVKAKYQEADEFINSADNDIMVATREMAEDGTVEMKTAKLTDEIADLDAEIDGINLLMDCAV